jgi:DNA-binding transcriptional LysR family regulator
MDALSFDQIQVFLAIVDRGSFSAAARRLRRAQSAISYAISRLESTLETPLFDRSGQRPILTTAGRALLPDARRIAEACDDMRARATGLHQGLEPELSVAVDTMFPMETLVAALKAFSMAYPTIPTRVLVQSLGAAAEFVLDGASVIGLLGPIASRLEALARVPLDPVRLVPVAAPAHPLAELRGPIPTAALVEHVQLVLTDRSQLTAGQDVGVLSRRTWRIGDLGAKHAMLRAGLGWGTLPAHMAADEIKAGRLVTLLVAEWARSEFLLPMFAAHRADTQPGPAARWMLAHLAGAESDQPAAAFARRSQ